ncbi:MAG: SBBP repeat-containing protein, partial [Chroococcales cyanobacterium]
MEDFTFNVALLTPASDIVVGESTVLLDLVFARAGDDIIYGYDPGVSNQTPVNIDILFGDLFDNTEAEFGLILDIIEGNFFAILDTPMPSLGADKFVLGDEVQPYYTSSDFFDLITTDLLGFNQFAIIYDFSLEEDTIQLHGTPEDYFLFEINDLSLPLIGEFSGEAIFSLQQGIPDLVALVVSQPEVDLDLNASYFQFVGNEPLDTPEETKIAQFGTVGLDFGNGVATDAAGNIYVTGSTSGSLFGTNSGFNDVWFTKHDSSGNQLLTEQFGTIAGDVAYSVVTDKDNNFYLAGTTGGDLFGKENPSASAEAWVAKFNANNELMWGRQVAIDGAFSTSGFGLQVDDENNVYLSGLAIKDNLNLEIFNFPVEDDSWVTKFNENGEQEWLTEIDTFLFNESYDLAVDSDGNSYLVGWSQGLVQESDPSRSLLKYDAWLTKVNPSGQIEWIEQFSSVDEGVDFAWGVDTDSAGNVYVYGWTTGELGTNDLGFENDSYDVWLTKFTPTGNQEWAKQIGSSGRDAAYLGDLVIDSSDNIFLTGYTNGQLGTGPSDEAYNAWVGRFDTDGDSIWIRQFGVQGQRDSATGVAVNNSGQLFVTGYTEGLLGTTTTQGQRSAIDAWVAQLSVDDGTLENFTGNFTDNVTNSDPSIVVNTQGVQDTNEDGEVMLTDSTVVSEADTGNTAEDG